MAAVPDLIYCAAGNPAFARAALAAGWLYGARLPAWFDRAIPLHFADQDWKAPDRAAYMAALADHRPAVATVLDLERLDQLGEVLSWAEEAAQFVGRVVIVPKASGVIDDVPRRVGAADVVLGYSVPTSYGGTDVPLWEFAGRPVHLLGGSPQAQLCLAGYLDVVSLDGGMAAQQACRCRLWAPRYRPLGRWVQLRDTGDGRKEGAPLECFRLSLAAIRAAWVRRCVAAPAAAAVDPPRPANRPAQVACTSWR
jgi:hypothetical protein